MAREKNLCQPDELQDRDKMAALIFESGFSTAKIVSEISGRGVGMGAIKQLMTDIGGRLEIKTSNETDGFAQFTITVEMPRSMVFEDLREKRR